jgi:hypothetical protein
MGSLTALSAIKEKPGIKRMPTNAVTSPVAMHNPPIY